MLAPILYRVPRMFYVFSKSRKKTITFPVLLFNYNNRTEKNNGVRSTGYEQNFIEA